MGMFSSVLDVVVGIATLGQMSGDDIFALPEATTEEYEEVSTKEVDLRYSLSSKYLPIVYGVRNLATIPIFADTLVDKPDTLYVIYAVCEGGIEGFLDVYLDGKPSICWNDADENTRVCMGRKKDAGDTLNIYSQGNAMAEDTPYTIDDDNAVTEVTVYNGSGINRLREIESIAADGNFFLQQNPVDGGPSLSGEEYWGSNHTLNDTAIIVCKYTLTATNTSVPQVTVDIAGKQIAEYSALGVPSYSNTSSTNPAWQLLDYLTSATYGGAIAIEDIDLSSFYDTAALCNTIDTSYSADWVPYWRYLGWDSQSDSNRAVLQCNTTLLSNSTVYKNIESILSQIGGSLNIIAGKYRLTILAEEDPEIDLHIDDTILSGFSMVNNSLATNYNTIQAGIVDPGKQWGTNAIIFNNSDYVAEDNNVIKKGSNTFPYITNYYTARALVERQLNISRSTKTIQFTLPFSYVAISINTHFTLTHPRYRWEAKRFIVKETVWTRDLKLRVIAIEYVEGMFINSNQVNNIPSDNIPVEFIRPPRDLQYIDYTGLLGGISGTLSWLPSTSPDLSHYLVRGLSTGTSRVIQVDPSLGLGQRLSVNIEDNTGAQQYSVTVVSYKGKQSKPVYLNVSVKSPRVLAPVSNLRITNNSSGSLRVWEGGDLELKWDTFTSNEGHTDFTYRISIETVSGLELLIIDTSNTSITYPLLDNQNSYFANNAILGVYRKLSVKIKVSSSDGAESIWSYL